MKKSQFATALAAALLFVPVGAHAKKKAAEAVEAAAAPVAAAAQKAASDVAPKVSKPIPMYVRVDAIDARAKTFTSTKKDQTVVNHTLTPNTTIKNLEADAKFADIKVGDTVSGLRLKKSPTEYEVVKITKFGVVPDKQKNAPKKP
jgi:hypothetical protein